MTSNIMKIKMTKNWFGWDEGEIVDVNDGVAHLLVEGGNAEYLKDTAVPSPVISPVVESRKSKSVKAEDITHKGNK